MSDILYHYTSMETLFAILNRMENDELILRATHINYLNDTTENEIAVNLLKDELLKYESSLSKEKSKELNDNLDNEKLSFFKNISYDKLPPFIFSLSEKRDFLPMWNTYANNSLGVAVGLDKSRLLQYISEGNNLDLICCDYHSSKAEKFITENIEDIYKTVSIDKLFIGITEGKDFKRWGEFEKMVLELKHSSFQYEKEWRVVIRPPFDFFSENNFDNLDFNVVNGLPKPYLEFSITSEMIKEIIIGPCSNFNLVSKSLLMMFNKIKLKSTITEPHIFPYEKDVIKISQSNCPYRAI